MLGKVIYHMQKINFFNNKPFLLSIEEMYLHLIEYLNEQIKNNIAEKEYYLSFIDFLTKENNQNSFKILDIDLQAFMFYIKKTNLKMVIKIKENLYTFDLSSLANLLEKSYNNLSQNKNTEVSKITKDFFIVLEKIGIEENDFYYMKTGDLSTHDPEFGFSLKMIVIQRALQKISNGEIYITNQYSQDP